MCNESKILIRYVVSLCILAQNYIEYLCACIIKAIMIVALIKCITIEATFFTQTDIR